MTGWVVVLRDGLHDARPFGTLLAQMHARQERAQRPDPTTARRTRTGRQGVPNDRQKMLTAGLDGRISETIDPGTFVGQIGAFPPAALRRELPTSAV